MYILSKDSKRIIAFTEGALEVVRNIGEGKEAKYAVCAEGMPIAKYPEEKSAITELLNIMNALEEGRTTYRIN